MVTRMVRWNWVGQNRRGNDSREYSNSTNSSIFRSSSILFFNLNLSRRLAYFISTELSFSVRLEAASVIISVLGFPSPQSTASGCSTLSGQFASVEPPPSPTGLSPYTEHLKSDAHYPVATSRTELK